MTKPEIQRASTLAILTAPFASFLFLPLVPLPSIPRGFSSPDEQYVYYAYLPPSLCNLSNTWAATTQEGAWVFETSSYNYTSSPSNMDIVGAQDGTSYELYDLTTKSLLRSGSLDRYQHVRVSFGTRVTSTRPFEVSDYYLKLVTNKPVSALVSGGLFRGEVLAGYPGENNTVASTFSSYVPSVEGGVVGKEFIFLAFQTFWEPKLYLVELNAYNIFATEDSSVRIYAGDGTLVQELEVKKLSMARSIALKPWKVYRITSSGNILVYGTSLNSMAYVPSLTGGYVGKSFLAARPGHAWLGDYQSLVIIALQEAKVDLYDMRKPAGSAPEKTLDLKQFEMVMDMTFQGDLGIRLKSTGNITVLIGGNGKGWGATSTRTRGYVIPQYLASDVTMLGARAGQEVGFFAPYQAIMFATGDTDVEVNGIPRSMKRDEFIGLASGPYTIKPSSAPLIVEVLGDMNVVAVGQYYGTSFTRSSFSDWGSYLISSQTIYRSYPSIEEGGGTDLYIYGGIGVAAVAAAVAVVLFLRRQRTA